MNIDLLYFDGCPSWQKGLEALQIAIHDAGMDASIHLAEVKSDQEAAEIKFLGSPSFQIDREDFWPEERFNYSMNCRIYKTPTGLRGWPTVEMLRDKLMTMMKEDSQFRSEV